MILMNKRLKQWLDYIKNCPDVTMNDVKSGDVIYMNNLHINPNETDPKKKYTSEFRPVIFIDHRTIIKHHELTKQLNEDVKHDKHALYGLVQTTTHHDKQSHPTNQYDFKIDPIGTMHYQAHPVDKHGNNKQPYIRPVNLIKYPSKDMDDLATQKSPASKMLFKKIGYINANDLDMIIYRVAKEITKRNKNIDSNKSYISSTLFSLPLNTTELFYKMHAPTNNKINPFANRPKNDPYLP